MNQRFKIFTFVLAWAVCLQGTAFAAGVISIGFTPTKYTGQIADRITPVLNAIRERNSGAKLAHAFASRVHLEKLAQERGLNREKLLEALTEIDSVFPTSTQLPLAYGEDGFPTVQRSLAVVRQSLAEYVKKHHGKAYLIGETGGDDNGVRDELQIFKAVAKDDSIPGRIEVLVCPAAESASYDIAECVSVN